MSFLRKENLWFIYGFHYVLYVLEEYLAQSR